MITSPLNGRTVEVVKLILRSSFEPVAWKYENLTQHEKNCCSKEEFEALKEWVLS